MFAPLQIEALGSASGKPSAEVKVVNSGILATGCCLSFFLFEQIWKKEDFARIIPQSVKDGFYFECIILV